MGSATISSNNSAVGLEPIILPFFLSAAQIRSMTPITYVTLFLNLMFIVIVILWVFYIVRSGVNIIRSKGESKPIEDAQKKITNIFISAAILFGFYAVLTLVGTFLGVGDFFNWPKAFSKCVNDQYYFQFVLENGAAAEDQCFQ